MEVGKRNISFGWVWILAGLIAGAIMGMWSFNGPMPSPVGDYTSLPRRLLRLSHIAFIALAIINILYGYEIDKIQLKNKLKRIGSLCMISGAILMPTFLIAAVFFEPFKYLTMISATLVIIAVAIMATGQIKGLPISK
jgi:cytochrome b561